MITNNFAEKVRSGKKPWLVAIAEYVAAVMLVFGLLPVSQSWAQSPPATTAPSPSFEVASIKPNRADDQRVMLRVTPDGFSAAGVSAKFLIEFAFNMKDFQVSGAPGWADSERYDIDAKMDEATIEAIKKLTPEQAMEQRRVMLQSLLAERFQLKVSHSSKELPVYALVVAKNGPKLKQSADAPSGPAGAGPRGQMRMQPGELTVTAMPISNLADRLSREVGRQVVDKTGLTGRYDFVLHWTPERQTGAIGGPGDAPPPADSSGPSIFTAIQEQLGLKLESQKGPVDTLIVEALEKPSEN